MGFQGFQGLGFQTWSPHEAEHKVIELGRRCGQAAEGCNVGIRAFNLVKGLEFCCYPKPETLNPTDETVKMCGRVRESEIPLKKSSDSCEKYKNSNSKPVKEAKSI